MLPWGLSHLRIVELCFVQLRTQSLVFLACPGVNPQDMTRTPYRASEGKDWIPRHACHHMYIIHLITGQHCFYRLTMSLKWPSVPKSDVEATFYYTIQYIHSEMKGHFKQYLHNIILMIVCCLMNIMWLCSQITLNWKLDTTIQAHSFTK